MRSVIAERFHDLCRMAGFTVLQVAQTLHVTERTVYAWYSGDRAVPYSAYKLMRILARFELPGAGWEGWHMHSGKLWTPEGHGFAPTDAAWWGLIVRKARLFDQLYAKSAVLDRITRANNRNAAAAPEGARGAASAGAAAAVPALPPGNHGENTAFHHLKGSANGQGIAS